MVLMSIMFLLAGCAAGWIIWTSERAWLRWSGALGASAVGYVTAMVLVLVAIEPGALPAAAEMRIAGSAGWYVIFGIVLGCILRFMRRRERAAAERDQS